MNSNEENDQYLENLGSETQRGAGKKILKGGTTYKRGYLGSWESWGKIFMAKFKGKYIGGIGISRHSRDAKFKKISNHGGIMPKP